MPISIHDYDARDFDYAEITDFNSSARPWYYQMCYEFGFFQTPNSKVAMRPYILRYDNWIDYCKRIYKDDSYTGPDIDGTNAYFGGLDMVADNILFTNAVEDPWQYAGMRHLENSAEQSSHNMAAYLIDCEDCGHCIDLKSAADLSTQAVVDVRKHISDAIAAAFGASNTSTQNLVQ